MCCLLKLGFKTTTFVAAIVSLVLNVSGLDIFYRWDLSYLTQEPVEWEESTVNWITVCTYVFLTLGMCASASAIWGLFKKQNGQVLAFAIYLILVVILAILGFVLCAVSMSVAKRDQEISSEVREEVIDAFAEYGVIFVISAVVGTLTCLASFVTACIIGQEAQEGHFC